ncbi:MAG: TIGR03790 family protein [Pseudomonadota bacterium]
MARVLAASLLVAMAGCDAAPVENDLSAKNLVLVINSADPDSVRVGELYAQVHQVPSKNVLYVETPVKDTLTMQEFRTLHRRVEAELPPGTSGVALAWAKPFRVACMSITSAFAFSGNVGACAQGCKTTLENPWYLDPKGTQATTRESLRTILLTAGEVAASIRLVERSRLLLPRAESPHATEPSALRAVDADALLVLSGDKNRDRRTASFNRLVQQPPGQVVLRKLQGFPSRADGVMFYFTGATSVPNLDRVDFLPGAIADHLTSHGGDLYGNKQMSALAWIEAGASGSYGTVREPCNFPGKFPDPDIVVRRYLNGEALLEAYWASVRMPGQGLFIGDPLARPFL